MLRHPIFHRSSIPFTFTSLKLILLFLSIFSYKLNSTIPINATLYHESSQLQFDSANDLIDMMKLNGDEVGLDIGCGDGKITSVISKKLSSGLIKGLDQSPSMIRFSQKKYASSKCQFILGDFEDFNESEVYDFITVFSAFYCFKDPEESYKKIIRALKPGGKAYIMTYPKEDPVWITCHQALLSNPNWEEIERTSIFNRLLPINKHLSILKSLPIEISLFEPKDTFSYHTDFSDFELYLKSWGVLCTDLTGSSYEDYINKALLFTKPVLINEHGCIKAPCKYINIILSKTPLGSNI